MASTEERISRLERTVEEISETLEIISDKKLLREIKKSLDDLKTGCYIDYKDIEELKRRFTTQP